jgi:hypothetical protein
MKAIIVSDLHIGSRHLLHEDFEGFLGNISEEYELVLVSFLRDLFKDYSFSLDVSVWHVAAEGPSVFDAELVAVHLGCPVGG